MPIRKTTRQKLLASAGTTVLATMVAGGAYAADVTVQNFTEATVTGHVAVGPSGQLDPGTTELAPQLNAAAIDASVSGAEIENATIVSSGLTTNGSSSSVETNFVHASATGNIFINGTEDPNNTLDIEVALDNADADLASLAFSVNDGIVRSAVTGNSMSVSQENPDGTSTTASGNAILAESQANRAKTVIQGDIPTGYSYTSGNEGSSAIDYGTAGTDPVHEASGSLVASTMQVNAATDHEARAGDDGEGNQITLDLSVNDANLSDPESSAHLDDNSIDAAMAVNSANSTISIGGAEKPSFEGSAVISNLQLNQGSAASVNDESMIAATIGDTDSVEASLAGSLSVQGNSISSSVAGNESVGNNGVAGNRILIGDQMAIHGAGTTAPGSNIAYGGASTHGVEGGSTADLVIMNSQGNTGSASGPQTLSSSTTDSAISASVDSVDGGSITLADNSITSQGFGNNASSALQSGEGSATFDASVALMSQQTNLYTSVDVETANSSVLALTGQDEGTVSDVRLTNESTISVSDNTSAARAYGNNVGQSIALDANTLNETGGLVDLTGGTTGETNDGNVSASGQVTIANLQSNYGSGVSAENAGSVIGLIADTKAGYPDNVVASSSLSTRDNTQEAVALGSSAANQIGSLARNEDGDIVNPGLSGTTVGAGAGIANIQIGDDASPVDATLSDAAAAVFSGTHVDGSSLAATGNVQRAIGYGTSGTNTLSVAANSVNVAAGGNGASGSYHGAGAGSPDPFHDYTGPTDFNQPQVESAFGVLNDQSIQSSVTASAEGMVGVLVEGSLSRSTLTDISGNGLRNEGNTLVAAAYGNDATNGIALDAGTIDSAGFAAVAHVGNAQAVFGIAEISATATGGAEVATPPTPTTFDTVVLTDIQGDVTDSSVSTSDNQVQALAIASKASNSLGVSGTTVETGAPTGNAGLSLTSGTLSGTTSFGVTNAQSGNGNVSASLLDDPVNPANSASVLTRIGEAGTQISGSAIDSDGNRLSAEATSNMAGNALDIQATTIATTSGVSNAQITDANLSALIGVFGSDGVDQFDVYMDIVGADGVVDVSATGENLSQDQINALLAQYDIYSPTYDPVQEIVTIPGQLGATNITVYATTGTPNTGGVTIVAEGDSILGSSLSVDGNNVRGAVTGNSAANSLSVGDGKGSIDSGSGLTIASSTVSTGGDITTTADHSLANNQVVGEGSLDTDVAGSFGIDAADAVNISGSTLSVSGNSQQSVAVANTATSTLNLDGNGVEAGSALASFQAHYGAAVSASSDVEVFAPAAMTSSSLDVSGNVNTALGVINDATNETTVSGTNIATLDTGAAAALSQDAMTATGDHVLQNVQISGPDTASPGSVESTANTSLFNEDGAATATTGLANSSFTMNGNQTYAEASANRASNTMTLDGKASQAASGGVFNTQANGASATAEANTNASLTLNGDGAPNPIAAALSNSTATLDGNSTTALARGNSATNVLNSLAGANYGTSTGEARVQFGATPSIPNAQATAAVLNAQANTGAVEARSVGTTYRVALNIAGGANPAVSNGTVSVSGNRIDAQAFGNSAVNSIALVGVNTGTSPAALGNTQVNSGAITASVTGAQIGIGANGSVGTSNFSVGGNTISANAVGNSVSNAIRRK